MSDREVQAEPNLAKHNDSASATLTAPCSTNCSGGGGRFLHRQRDHRLINSNAAFAAAHGISASSVPTDQTADPKLLGFWAAFQELFFGDRPDAVEYSVTRGPDRVLRYEMTGLVVPSDGDRPALYVGRIQDVTQRWRLQLSFERRRELMRKLLMGGKLEDLLKIIVLDAEETNPGLICSILLLDESGTRLYHSAAPSLPDFYISSTDGFKIGPAVGSCGAAAFTGQRVVVRDIRTHPNWHDMMDLADRAGLRACWSQPIKNEDGSVVGTFAMYYREPRLPSQSDLAFISSSADLAAVAISRSRYEQTLKNERDPG